MPLLPDLDLLYRVYHSPSRPQRLGDQQRKDATQLTYPRKSITPFDYYSMVDDAKDKAKKLGAEAAKDFEKASAKAQSATGPIKLYSLEYYAACTFGGLLACVCKVLA
jgi:solute carrier family 25 (mitochondrial phosphate transporter), member 3